MTWLTVLGSIVVEVLAVAAMIGADDRVYRPSFLAYATVIGTGVYGTSMYLSVCVTDPQNWLGGILSALWGAVTALTAFGGLKVFRDFYTKHPVEVDAEWV